MKKLWPFIFAAYLIGYRLLLIVFPKPSLLRDHFKYFLYQDYVPTPWKLKMWMIMALVIAVFLFFAVVFWINNFLLKPCSQKTKRKYLLIDKMLLLSFFAGFIPFIFRTKFKNTSLAFINTKEFWGYWYLTNLGLWFTAKLFLWGILFIGKEQIATLTNLKTTIINYINWFTGKSSMPNGLLKLHTYLQRRYHINWFFIAIAFVTLSTINIYLALLFSTNFQLNYSFLILLTILLTFLQLAFFIFVAELISRHIPKIMQLFFLTIMCAYLLLRCFEVFLITRANVNISEAYVYFKQSSLLLLANKLHISLLVLYVAIIAWLILSIICVFIYKKTTVITKNYRMNNYTIISLSFALIISATMSNFMTYKNSTTTMQLNHRKIMPLPYAIPRISREHIVLKKPIDQLPTEKTIQTYLQNTTFKAKIKPDIYFIILESIRGDFVNPELSPNLYALKQDSFHAKHSFASASCTWQAWYSLFHSRPSYEWEQAMRNNSNIGGVPLAILKNAGYKIHALGYPSVINKLKKLTPPLHCNDEWQQFHNICFGKDGKLFDSYCPPETWDSYNLNWKNPVADKDKIVIEKAIEKSKHSRGGNCYIICLDAGHFPYSWSKDFQPTYHPTFPKNTLIHNKTTDPKKRKKNINLYKNT